MSACVHLFPDKLIDSFNLMFSLRQEHTLQKIFLENSKLEKEKFAKQFAFWKINAPFLQQIKILVWQCWAKKKSFIADI